VESLLHEINYDIDVKISNIITTKNDDNSINNNHINNCDDNNSISNNDDKDKNNDDNNGNDMDSVDNILQTGELLEALSRGESESTLFGSIGCAGQKSEEIREIKSLDPFTDPLQI